MRVLWEAAGREQVIKHQIISEAEYLHATSISFQQLIKYSPNPASRIIFTTLSLSSSHIERITPVLGKLMALFSKLMKYRIFSADKILSKTLASLGTVKKAMSINFINIFKEFNIRTFKTEKMFLPLAW